MTKTVYDNRYFEGERSLFGECDATLTGTTFGPGESPLKHARNLTLDRVIFQWKYPLWYCRHVDARNMVFEEMSRSGVWYTDDITLTDSSIQAPKLFRRCKGVTLEDTHFSDAAETLWTCREVTMNRVQVNGDYFGKDSSGIKADHLDLVGNYAFDGASDVTISHSRLISKDAFWNCRNVTITDSFIDGEYLGWNTSNLTLENCTVESDQGLCYIDKLVMRKCRLIHTGLAFEYCSDIDAEIDSEVDSIKNPISGVIRVGGVGDLIMDPARIDPSRTDIHVRS
ncbi:DUF3737 family protein [Bifidobacterium favimelis]|uniref:DUF3737 family protein n=1 Tax=Bifidobacterium favimelis TaxID=3122979 RepID=A0ABU8ZR22_9BIFI